MNGIQFLVNPPKPVVRQGRLVKLIDLKESVRSGKPSTGNSKKEINARWYAKNKEKVLEYVREYRNAKREFLNRKARERRAQERVAREYAAVRGNRGGVQSV